MYTNKGDLLRPMPKPTTLRQLIDGAARGAVVLPDMAQRHDGIVDWLLPENCRMVDAAMLYNMQLNASQKIRNVRQKIESYAPYFQNN